MLAEKIKDTKGETAIVVDDGIASGFTMLVAISLFKKTAKGDHSGSYAANSSLALFSSIL